MTSICKSTFTTLAVLAVACAQMFGMQRGFVCDHEGAIVETESDHCHRVMVEGQKDSAPCHGNSAKDCTDSGEREEHAPLKVVLEVSPSSLVTIITPAFIAVQIAEISVRDWLMQQKLAEDDLLFSRLDAGGTSPPAAVRVARCIVMLV
tara:strand:+ start:278 stop:724 length:447 start_codon:yes stop_codon:yes gene_type:complete